MIDRFVKPFFSRDWFNIGNILFFLKQNDFSKTLFFKFHFKLLFNFRVGYDAQYNNIQHNDTQQYTWLIYDTKHTWYLA